MEATQTIDYALSKLAPVFTKLEALGTQGWQVAVRQQVIEGWGAAAVWLAIVTAASVVAAVSLRHTNNDEDCGAGWFFLVIVSGVVLVVAFCVALAAGSATAGQILNPEWAAIQALTGLVR